jgi:hypothetical protein
MQLKNWYNIQLKVLNDLCSVFFFFHVIKMAIAAISFIWSSTMSPVYFLSEKSLQKPKRSQGASQRGVFSVFVFVTFIFDDFFTCLVSPLKCLLYTMILIQHIGMALPISTIQLGQKQTNTYNFEFLNHVGFWQGVMYMWFLSKVGDTRHVKKSSKVNGTNTKTENTPRWLAPWDLFGFCSDFSDKK